jgi:spore germination protein KA
MLRKLRKLLRRRKRGATGSQGAPETRQRSQDEARHRKDKQNEDRQSCDKQGERLSPQLDVNAARVQAEFGHSEDLRVRHLRIGRDGDTHALLVSIDGLTDKQYLTKSVLLPITQTEASWSSGQEAYQYLKERLLAVADVSEEAHTWVRVLVALGAGDSALMIQGVSSALILGTSGWKERTVEEPVNEPTIRGIKEGFVESLRTNTALVRRRIGSSRLRIEEHRLGRVSQTAVALVYVAGLADERVVQEVRDRLQRINVDAIQASGQLEEFIRDAPYSPFPTWMPTERPDRVSGALLEGRIVVMTDGSSFQLVAPATLTMFLGTPEDYFSGFLLASALRALRFAAFVASLVLTPVYVAIVTFHQEMLPTSLILNIASQREGVPFPTVIEALVIEVLFELMREAGVRLPRIVGPAISIIGALVLGDAAIRAGLVSPIMVVVVAATGIASFSVPVFSFGTAPRLLRFGFLVLAGALGLFGVIAGLFALQIHLISLRSLGVPYAEPLGPVMVTDLKDALIRVPWWRMDRRPRLVGQKSGTRRQGRDLRPEPPTSRRQEDPR